MSRIFDVIIIGGGPAGMMAAGHAVRSGAKVLLVDKNDRCGRKLALTGKGRCNVTNDCDIQTFLKNLPQNGKFLYSALRQFSPQDTMAFFEELGVPLKVERGRRVFPASDKAMDIVGAMRRFALTEQTTFRSGRAEALLFENGRCAGTVIDGQKFVAQAVIIATGGLSYPITGSNGDGYKLAQSAGHTIVPPRASLVALTSTDAFCALCAGLTLKNTAVTLFENGKQIFTDFGELLFTHTGVSGPTILSASAHMRQKEADYALKLDLKPALSEKTLDERLLRELAEGLLQTLKTIAGRLLPQSLIHPVLEQGGLPPEDKGAEVTKAQRRAFLTVLKGFWIRNLRLGPIEEAVVTAGGVSLNEVNPRNMESKLMPGLYFAGEVLDLDGYTGGFNLQIAFSTGYVAGISASSTIAATL
jgi:predicted Rossmann fold flavoprotein